MNTVGTSLPYFILKKHNIIHESLFFKTQLDRRQTKKTENCVFSRKKLFHDLFGLNFLLIDRSSAVLTSDNFIRSNEVVRTKWLIYSAIGYFVLMISSECKNSRWSINEIHNNFYWWSVETFFILQWIKRTWRHVEIDVCLCQFFPLSTEKSIFVTHWHMALKIRKICVKKAG